MRKSMLAGAGIPALLMSALFLSSPFDAAPANSKGYWVYVGTYTGKTGSKGIYTYRFQPSTGDLVPIGLVAETPSPSFLATDRGGKYLYAVNEAGGKTGSVSAYSIDRTSGKLNPLNTVSSRGSGPCHLMVDNTGKMLVVANYDSGSVAAMPIGADGKLGEAASFDQHTGKGTNPDRQEGPHAHCAVISPNNKFAFVADLGLDKVFCYRIDPAGAKLTANDPPYGTVKGGSGPRHFAIHPNHRYAYVINEMGNTVTAFRYDDERGSLDEIQTISTLPSDFRGENTTAEIEVHPNGRFVYGSNRGHDSIAVFSVDQSTGRLKLVEITSTKGREPRNFAIDPTARYLFAANQNSNDIVLFRIENSGKLTPTGKSVTIGAPVCVIFVPVQ